MLTTHIIDDGNLVIGVFSGTTRDAAILDAYESTLQNSSLKPNRDELYYLKPGAKLLISYTAYKKIAELSNDGCDSSNLLTRTAIVGHESDLSENVEIYKSAVLNGQYTNETISTFQSIESALIWLGRQRLLAEVLALISQSPVNRGHSLSILSNEQYADVHDILNHVPIALFEFIYIEDGAIEFLYANEPTEFILGLQPDELISCPMCFTSQIHEQDFHKAIHILGQLGTDLPGVTEVRYLHPMKGEIWLKLACATTGREFKGRPVATAYAEDITDKKIMEYELEYAATHDALTLLLRHDVVIRQLKSELTRAQRYNHPISVIMLDIDHFKSINDQFGHSAGDSVLALLGAIIADNCRDTDRAGRYGGEEFLLVLPETHLKAASNIAERLRQFFANEVIIHNGNKITATASFGIAAIENGVITSAEQLIDEADQALYHAKRSGRNCCKIYSRD